MRCFIAVDVPDELRAQLAALGARLRQSGVRASWVKPENMHLTLVFLGDIEEEAAHAAGEVLARGSGDLTPFDLRIHGVGAFPSIRKPSIVWAGVEPHEGPLVQCYSLAVQAGQAAGVPEEKRPFHPHFTLARIKDPRAGRSLKRFLEGEAGFDGGAFTVASVTLYESQLTKKGPIYSKLREVVL